MLNPPASEVARSLTSRGYDCIGPGSLRVLLAIMTYPQRYGTPPTTLDLMRELEMRSSNGVHRHIKRLRRSGLVVPGNGRRTLIAAVRLEILQ